MVNPKVQGAEAKKEEWLLISELASKTTYKKGYLSLMARQGKLKARKHNNNWYSTLNNLKAFESEKKEIKTQRNEHLRLLYREKSADSIADPTPKQTVKVEAISVKTPPLKKAPIVKVKMSKDNIFDEVQRELEEVLSEIREKQRKLKRGFPAYKEAVAAMPEQVLDRERKETEDISEKLIMDLGRLINTANEAQEGRTAAEVDSGYEISSEDMFSIPVKRISKEMGKTSSREGRPIDLDRRNLISKVNEEEIDATKIAPIEKDNFLNESYNYFPFERTERPEENDKTSKILMVLIVILLAIAAGLVFMIFYS